MSYRPSSKVLFLTNCSLTKTRGGIPEYDEQEAITSVLPTSLKNRFLDRREKAFQYVKMAREFTWQGTPVSELEFNKNLAKGKDFGGRRTCAYLPALHRYEGRFFQALGLDGRNKLENSKHHTLFLSGLYGLLRPLEPIQIYSCLLDDHVSKLWREKSLLTEILLKYISRFQIRRIIDLTAIDAYRQLIDWDKIAETETDVLHCFHVMAAGDYALTFFGMLLGDLLNLSEDDLATLESNTRKKDVIFRSLGETESGLPKERPSPEKPIEPKPGPNRIDTDQLWRFASKPQFHRKVRESMNQFTKIMQAAMDICREPIARHENTIEPWEGRASTWQYRLDDLRVIYRLDKDKRVVYFENIISVREDSGVQKIRELVAKLKSHGFVETKGGGKGSHRKFKHPRIPGAVTVSGGAGDDASLDLVRQVQRAVEQVM